MKPGCEDIQKKSKQKKLRDGVSTHGPYNLLIVPVYFSLTLSTKLELSTFYKAGVFIFVTKKNQYF